MYNLGISYGLSWFVFYNTDTPHKSIFCAHSARLITSQAVGSKLESLVGRFVFKELGMSRDMSAKRKKLFRDRGESCELCGYAPNHNGFLHVHHIKPVQYGGTNDMNNLIIVCEKCHADCHGYTKKNYIDRERACLTDG